MFSPWFSWGPRRPPRRLFGRHREPFEKWWPDRLLYATIFKRVLDILGIKIRHLKGENGNFPNGKALDDSIQMDWTLKGAKLFKVTNILFQDRTSHFPHQREGLAD